MLPGPARLKQPVLIDADGYRDYPSSRRRRHDAATTYEDPLSTNGHDLVGDETRPTLRRLLSETERQVAESSRSVSDTTSLRDSFDLLRMTPNDEHVTEVEVILHQVGPGETLAGIAVQYGIDVSL